MLRCVYCGNRVDALAARGLASVPCKARDNTPCERIFDRWVEAAKGRSGEELSSLPGGAAAAAKRYHEQIEALD